MIDTAQRSDGGRSRAASIVVAPKYDAPKMPTLPSQNSRDASHSTVSYPSAPSWTKGWNSPCEEKRPRVSVTSTA